MKTKIFLLTLLSVTLVFSQGRNRSRLMTWDENLNLTTEQMQQITQMRETMQPAMQELRQKVRDLERELRDENRQENPDADRVSELQAQIDEFRAAMDNLMTGHRASIRAILTPEQQAIFDERQFGPREDRPGQQDGRDSRRGGRPRSGSGGRRY